MKYVYVITVLALSTLLTSPDVHAQWWKHDGFSTIPVQSVHFPTSSLGYMSRGILAGPAHTLHRTIDAGRTWTSVEPFDEWQRELSALWFTNATTGFGISDAGTTVIKTTNGGSEWDTVLANLPALVYLRTIRFVDEEFGYVTGFLDTHDPSTVQPIVYTTYDGGQNWFDASSWMPDRTGYMLQNVSFTTKLNGIAIGYPSDSSGERFWYRSTTGGYSWTKIPPATDRFVNGILGRTDGSFLVTGFDSTYISTDHGASWIRAPYGIDRLTRVYAPRDGQQDHIITWGLTDANTKACILMSSDAGATWTKQSVDGFRSDRAVGASWVIDERHAVVGTSDGDVFVKSPTASVDDITVNNLTVSPNPFSGPLTIHRPESLQGHLVVSLVDVTGTLHYTSTIAADAKAATLQTENLPRGFYLIRVTNNVTTASTTVLHN